MSENKEIDEELSDLENLPIDLCLKIYERLEFKDLMNLFLVSKRIASQVNESETLMRKIKFRCNSNEKTRNYVNFKFMDQIDHEDFAGLNPECESLEFKNLSFESDINNAGVKFKHLISLNIQNCYGRNYFEFLSNIKSIDSLETFHFIPHPNPDPYPEVEENVHHLTDFLRRHKNLKEMSMVFHVFLNDLILPVDVTFPLRKLTLSLLKKCCCDDDENPCQREHSRLFNCSKFIENHKTTLTKLHLDGNFDNNTYKAVFNELSSLKILSLSSHFSDDVQVYSGLKPNVSVEIFKFGFESTYDRFVVPFPKFFFENLPNVKYLISTCEISEESWALINLNMSQLETIYFIGFGSYLGVDLVFPNVRHVFFDTLTNSGKIVGAFPTLELLEIKKTCEKDEITTLESFATNLEMLKHLKVEKLESGQFEVSRLLHMLAKSTELTLTFPKDSLCVDISLPILVSMDKIQTLQSYTTFTETQMIIKADNYIPIDEERLKEIEADESLSNYLELLPFDIFKEIYQYVTKEDTKNLLTVSKSIRSQIFECKRIVFTLNCVDSMNIDYQNYSHLKIIDIQLCHTEFYHRFDPTNAKTLSFENSILPSEIPNSELLKELQIENCEWAEDEENGNAWNLPGLKSLKISLISKENMTKFLKKLETVNTLENLELIEPLHENESELADFLRRQTDLQDFKISFDANPFKSYFEPEEPSFILPSILNLPLKKLSILYTMSQSAAMFYRNSNFEDYSNFITNFKSTLRELYLSGDFCGKTYNVVLNELKNLKVLSLSNCKRIPERWLNEIGSIHSVEVLKIEDSKSLFEKLQNVKKLTIDNANLEVWKSIALNIEKLENLVITEKIDLSEKFSELGLIFPSLKLLKINRQQLINVIKCRVFGESFPNMECVEVCEFAEKVDDMSALLSFFGGSRTTQKSSFLPSDLIKFLQNCPPSFKRLVMPKWLTLDLEDENLLIHTEMLDSYIKNGTLILINN